MPHRIAEKISIRYLKSKAPLFFIACISGQCALWATAQENRLRKNYEETQNTYRELAAPLHPRTAAKELSFQYFAPGNDAKDADPSLRNVQILYLDTAKFMSNMAFMAESLGVQCNYCHDLNDFSSDTLSAKQRAREMIQMVQKLNQNQQENKIDCHTCHQGKTLAMATRQAKPEEKQKEPATDEPMTANTTPQRPEGQEKPPESTDAREQQAAPSSKDRAEGWTDESVQKAIGGKEVMDRLNDHLADRLLSQGVDYTEQLGQKTFFGKHFQIDSDLRLGRRGLYGDVDVLIPFGGVEKKSTWFLQPGLVLWEDRHGIDREDFSLGLAHRFLRDESVVFGLGGFFDYNADYGHRRLGFSADYQSGFGYLSFNLYKRLSSWETGRREDVFEYEESALDGAEFYFDYALTEPLRIQGRASIWRSRLENRPENTRTGHEIGLAHALWPGVELTANYSRYDDQLYDDRWSLGVHLRLPVREQQPSTKFRPDLFRPIERQKRIFTEERVIKLSVSPPLGPGGRPPPGTVFLNEAFPLEIALPKRPTADVFVTPRHSGVESVEYSITGRDGPFDERITLRFTPVDWNQPQTIWVRIPPPTQPARSALSISQLARANLDSPQAAGGDALRQVNSFSVIITLSYRSDDPRYDDISSSLTLEIRNTERSTLEFSQASYDVNEAGGTVTLEITLSAMTNADVNVTVSTSDVTATAPDDYTAVSAQTFTIPAGQTRANLAITIAEDNLAEGEEQFTVTLGVTNPPAGVSLGTPSTSTVTINDNDTAPNTIALGLSPTSVTEEGGAQTVTVTATVQGMGRFTTDQTVNVTVTADSAEAADFAPVTAFDITIAAGQESGTGTFSLTPVNDVLAEGSETLTVSGTSTALRVNPATLTIADDDATPDTIGLSVSPASVTEEGGAQTVTVTATVQGTGRFTTDRTVNVTVAADSAEAADFTPVTAFDITIAAGQESETGTFSLIPVNDVLVEGSETLMVSGTSTALRVNPATLTINDNDTATLDFSEAAYTVAENAGTLTLPVALSAPAAADVNFTFSTTDDTAAAPGDYTAVTAQTSTILAGQTSVNLAITIIDDDVQESDETFSVTITAGSPPPGVSLGSIATVTVTIEDDDAPSLDGQALYGSNGCGGCHATGVLGAPVLGNTADWMSRLVARGIDELYNSAIMGRLNMPARGGRTTDQVSDAELRAIVDYMIDQAGLSP